MRLRSTGSPPKICRTGIDLWWLPRPALEAHRYLDPALCRRGKAEPIASSPEITERLQKDIRVRRIWFYRQLSPESAQVRFAAASPPVNQHRTGTPHRLPMHNMKRQFGGVPVGADRDPTLRANSAYKSKACFRVRVGSHVGADLHS
jgi:hypothetical protein